MEHKQTGENTTEGALRQRLAAYFLSAPSLKEQTAPQRREYLERLRQLGELEQQELLAELSRRCDSPADALRAAAAQSGGLLGRALDILSGQEKAGHTAARAFCQALRGDELGIFLACQELTKLHREEYADFCDESCRLLTRSVMMTGSRRSVDIFEYLEKQRAMLNQNPSVTALAGALAAFCGGL